jgi:hypothetical protein
MIMFSLRRRKSLFVGLAAVVMLALAAMPMAKAAEEPPVANPDTASVDYEMAVDIDVLANDTGSDLILTIAPDQAPAHGTAMVWYGKIRYIGGEDFSGKDCGHYTILNEYGTSFGEYCVNVGPRPPQPNPNLKACASYLVNSATVPFSFDFSSACSKQASAYQVQWTKGGAWSAWQTSPYFSYKYASPGTYQVTLKVKDNQGWTSQVSFNVYAKAQAAPSSHLTLTDRHTLVAGKGSVSTAKWSNGSGTVKSVIQSGHYVGSKCVADGKYLNVTTTRWPASSRAFRITKPGKFCVINTAYNAAGLSSSKVVSIYVYPVPDVRLKIYDSSIRKGQYITVKVYAPNADKVRLKGPYFTDRWVKNGAVLKFKPSKSGYVDAFGINTGGRKDIYAARYTVRR